MPFATESSYFRPFAEASSARLPDNATDRQPASLGVTVSLNGIEKSFGATPVLNGIDLEIAAGEFVAIVGKSGCGKSTLLRLLVGLDTPDAGHIRFGAADGSRAAPNKRIVFQEPRLLPWGKVLDNVAVGLRDGRRNRTAAQAALEAVELADKADQWPARLSGGQRQRVALARALVSRPDFLALDEPLGALDALTRITMQQLVESMWEKGGFTAVFVTHDVAEAVKLADRVVVLDGGRIVEDLPIELPRPRDHASTAPHERRLLDRILN